MLDLNIFYRKNYSKQLKKLERILYMDVDLAYDVLQESYLKAHKNRRKFDPEKGKDTAWFNSIMYSTLRDFQRKHKITPKFIDIDVNELTEESSIGEKLLSDESFGKALDEVRNHKHRKIVVLHYVLGYSCKEIAAMESITVNNVTTICSRFRQQLRGDT